MGLAIYCTILLIEVSLAVVCIVTKSLNTRIRNTIYIAMFFIYIVLNVLGIIHIQISYYLLSLVLFIFFILSVIRLKKNKENKPYKLRKVIAKGIGVILLFLIASTPAILFPGYHTIKSTGKYEVSSVVYTYTDNNRIETFSTKGDNRKLNIEFWYPENEQNKSPLVVFSHGGISNRKSNESLYIELASHGYVVCSIDHTYHSLSTTDTNGKKVSIDKKYMKELQTENAKKNKLQSYEYYQKWMKLRVDDINYVIDSIIIEANKDTVDKVYKVVDIDKIGVMGHSLGGSAALGVGRVNENVDAVIALESPMLTDIVGVENGEFIINNEIYPVPMLNVYTDGTWSRLSDLPQYAQNYNYLNKEELKAFDVYIKDAGHFSITDLALSSPVLTFIFNGFKTTKDTEYCLKTVNRVCLDFFDCYLKENGEFIYE